MHSHGGFWQFKSSKLQQNCLPRASTAHIGQQGKTRLLDLSTYHEILETIPPRESSVNRAVRNHMSDDVDDDEAIIRDADLPADIIAMLGLKDCDDNKALTTPSTNRWRPWAPTRVIPRRTPALRTVPKAITRRSSKVSVEIPESDIKPQIVATDKSNAGSALPKWEKPAPDSLGSVEGFLASIQLGETHAQMLLDEGIKTHQDLLHIKEIIGTESLKLVRESLKSRGFTTFELIKFISAVKGIPS
ncbi:hypothetical protein H4582DRAFT_128746 [Lactarius indigo]|nr:hypothetical protein H4582DRAFT_128746 [Lactarius indigo]